MYINAAIFWNIQKLLGQDLAEGSHDDQIRFFLPDPLYRFRPPDPLRLEDGNPVFLSADLHS